MAEKINIKLHKQLKDFRLDKALKEYFPSTPFSMFQKLIRKKLITVNNKKTDSSYRIKQDDIVNVVDFIYKNLKQVSKENLEKENQIKSHNKNISQKDVEWIKNHIIYKDDNILALNKPYDLPVQGGSGVKKSVADFLPFLKYNAEQTPKLAHRLDRHTTGTLLIARSGIAANILFDLFKKKEKLTKKYTAVILGKPTKNKGVINLPLIKKHDGKTEKVFVDQRLGKEAVTEYKVISYSEKYNISLVELNLITGRTHQIRVHLKEIGHPIIGDGKYGGKKVFIEGLSDKLHLHAREIIIDSQDLSEEPIKITARLSNHIQKTVDKTKLAL